MKRYNEDFELDQELMDTIASYMDDEIREDLHESLAHCNPEIFLLSYIARDSDFTTLLENEFGITISEEEVIASEMKASDGWIPDLCARLCELAGLKEEYDKADGDTFEDVVFRAAEKLGVEII